MSLCIDLICRTCESSSDLKEIFDEKTEEIASMLTAIADISVKVDDHLPKRICIDCLNSLQHAYDFKLLCEQTDQKLREVCITRQTETKEEESTITIFPNYLTDDDIIEEDTGIVDEEDEDNELLSVIEVDDPIVASEPNEIEKIETIDGTDIKVEYLIETDQSLLDEENVQASPKTKTKIEKLHRCDTCSFVFESASQLNAHTKIHGDKRFQCPTCLKWFSKRYRLRGHQEIHKPGLREFACDLCDKKYTNRGNLDRHIRHFHIQERSYPCQICGMCFARSSILMQHLAVHSNERNYQCNLCEKKFKTPYYLTVHKKSHIPVEHRPKRKPNRKSTKTYICQFCGKRSASLSSYKNHIRTHTGEKPYACEVCQKRFSFQQSLSTHQLQHTGEKPYRCDVCQMSFRQIGHLKGHKLTHSGEKKHKCPYCEKCFTLRGNLTVHTRLHTGEKPFHCSICPKRFYDSNGLKRHILSHSRNNERMNVGIEEVKSIEIDDDDDVDCKEVSLDNLNVILEELDDAYTEIIESEIAMEV